jgi:hypothetical protein
MMAVKERRIQTCTRAALIQLRKLAKIVCKEPVFAGELYNRLEATAALNKVVENLHSIHMMVKPRNRPPKRAR